MVWGTSMAFSYGEAGARKHFKDKSRLFRINAASLYACHSPGSSAYFARNGVESLHDDMSLCPWCRALYSPDDHTFRLTSKRRKSRDIVQLEKKLRLGRHLQKLERKRYQKFYKESNCLILSCKRCKKSTKFKMPTPMRKETKSFMSTPVQDRVQAQHSSISPIGSLSWNTTPNNRSSSSFGNTSTPSSSTKKLKQRQKHSKLQEMLRTANHQQSFLNSPLTEFLSSV